MTGSLANRLASLCRMGKVINSSLVLDEVLDVVLDNLIELMSGDFQKPPSAPPAGWLGGMNGERLLALK